MFSLHLIILSRKHWHIYKLLRRLAARNIKRYGIAQRYHGDAVFGCPRIR